MAGIADCTLYLPGGFYMCFDDVHWAQMDDELADQLKGTDYAWVNGACLDFPEAVCLHRADGDTVDLPMTGGGDITISIRDAKDPRVLPDLIRWSDFFDSFTQDVEVFLP
jgi:hypothetical protein